MHLIDNTWRESLYKGVQYVDTYLQNFEMSKQFLKDNHESFGYDIF